MKLKSTIPIFNGELIIIIDNKVNKHCKKYGTKTPDNSDDYGACVFSGKNKRGVTQYIVVLRKDHLTMKTIAHESLHITHKLLQDRGIDTSYDNDEITCYLLGYFVDKINRAKKKYKRL